MPFESITNPPYIDGHSRVQFCRTRGKRDDYGSIWTQDDHSGRVIYQLKIDITEYMKRFDVCYLHVHSMTPEELRELDNKEDM